MRQLDTFRFTKEANLLYQDYIPLNALCDPAVDM